MLSRSILGKVRRVARREWANRVSIPAARRILRLMGTASVAWHAATSRVPRIEDIPVVINSFNRVTSLRAQVQWLERAGFKRIIIIDNASTYPDLLEYYRQTPHRVLLMPNLGSNALWMIPELWRSVRSGFYIYTDSDIIPAEGCPVDAVNRFLDILTANPGLDKVGFGLRIDDLPASYSKGDAVIAWESRFWKHAARPGEYSAPIDTTFALYKPFASGWSDRAIRTGPPYVAHHTPWYIDSSRPTEEQLHYELSARKDVSTWVSANGNFHHRGKKPATPILQQDLLGAVNVET